MAIQNSLNIDQLLKTTSAVTFAGLTLNGDMTLTAGAIDVDLVDNNASAISFDAADKAGILEIVTTDGSEGVNFSGFIAVDTISEKTGANGVVIDSVTMKDGDIDMTAAAHSIAANIGANNLTIAGSSSTVIIPGNLTIQGTTTTADTDNLNVKDKNILINDGGSASSAGGAGIDIEEDSSVTGYAKVSSGRGEWEFKAPGNAGILTVDINATKTITVAGALNIEADSVINQDLSSDASPSFTQVTVGNTGLVVGSSTPFSDSSGTLTLQNIDALDATTEATIEAAIDTLANLTSIQSQTVTLSGSLTVSGASDINQDLTTDASVTFANVTMATAGALRTSTSDTNTLLLQAYDVDGTAYTTFMTLTAGNTPTCVLSGDVTGTTQSAADNSTKLATTAYADAAASGTTYYTFSEVTGTTQAASVNYSYIANNAALVTITLPATASIGQKVRVLGKGAGGWKLAQNASQTIYFGDLATTTGAGGYLASTDDHDVVEAICITANNDWIIANSQGNITIV